MNFDSALELLARNPQAPLDLAELAFCLARDEYPHLDVEACVSEIDALAHDAREMVRGDFSNRVTGLCRFLFHEMGFHGNTRNYYDPRNSYLNEVLERRTGIPISLSAIMIAVGRRVGLRVSGVGLPGHFVVKVTDGEEEILIDPFHGGRRLTISDCEILIHQVTGHSLEVTALHLQEMPLGLMMKRMFNNLRMIYLQRKDFRRALRVLERCLQINDTDADIRRDLGWCLLKTGHPGKAIDHLESYLSTAEEADDVDKVTNWLQLARRRLAEAN